MSRTKLLVAFALLAAATALLPASGLAGKRVVKAKMTLAEGAPLDIEVKGLNLENCAEWVCLVAVGSTVAGKKADLQIEVRADGNWVAFAQEEEDKKNKKDGDDDDSSGDDDDSSLDGDKWRDKPVLTDQERIDKIYEKAMGKYKVEKADGTVLEEGGKRILRLAAELLPKGTFDVHTNGYFGLYLADVKIGSENKTGVVRVSRK